MAQDLSPLIREIEELIQEAQLRTARQRLQAVQTLAAPRGQRLALARLARRAGLITLALRLLNPIVRPPAKSPRKCLPEEAAEYAGCLIRAGAHQEALQILSELEPGRVPDIWLYQAYARIIQWDYQGATPYLTRYLSTTDLSISQRIIGELNLAAAFVHERRTWEAAPLLEKLLEITLRERLPQFHGNTLELCAQDAIFFGRWREAGGFLDRAERHLSQVGGLDSLFVRKWKAIARALEHREREPLEALEDVRREAEAIGHWETVRDCDLYLGHCRKDEGRLTAVYYGTPFESFRRRLLELSGPDFPLPPLWIWNPEGTKARILDLTSGTWAGEKVALKPGQLLHRLLAALASDFYRPFRTASLFAALYPREYFDPLSSVERVYEAIRRLRAWFRQGGFQARIEEKGGGYRLILGQGAALALRSEPSPDGLALERLRETFGHKEFTTRQAAKALGVSERTASRIIRDCRDKGDLAALGTSHHTRYRLVG